MGCIMRQNKKESGRSKTSVYLNRPLVMEQTQCHSAGLALNYKTDNLLLPFIISLCILRDAIVVGVETYCVSLQYSGLKNRPGVEKAWV